MFGVQVRESRSGSIDQQPQVNQPSTQPLGGEQVVQTHTEPNALQQSHGPQHVDNAPLQQVQDQIAQLPLNQVAIQPQVNVPQQGQVGQGGQQGQNVPQHPPQIQQQVNDRLMTFDTLANSIGHQPHADKLGGLWKMSTQYKAVQTSLNTVNQTLGNGGLDTVKNNPQQLRNELNQLKTDAQAYIDKHTGVIFTTAHEKSKIAAMKEVITRADAALAVIDDPAVGTLPQGMTLQQAVDIKKMGIKFGDCDFHHFVDNRLDLGQGVANFGAGNANTVAKLVYGQGVNAETKIFKPEPDVDRNPLKAQSTLGVDLNSPHYGSRNVASKAIDTVLGGNNIVGSRFAMHNGAVGLLMDKAEGKVPLERVKIPVTQQQQGFIDGIVNANVNNPGQAAKLLKSMEFVEVNGAWMKIEPRYVNPFGANAPTAQTLGNLQQNLCKLEWADFVCGQFDRHGENYFVHMDNVTGNATVTGIDNDLAFGKNTKSIPDGGPNPATGYNGIGMPQLIDRTTYTRLMGADFDRDVLPGLAGRLTGDEIAATRDRFEQAKGHAQQLATDGKVVDNWQTWQSGDGQSVTQFLGGQPNTVREGVPTCTSYYQRDFHEHYQAFQNVAQNNAPVNNAQVNNH